MHTDISNLDPALLAAFIPIALIGLGLFIFCLVDLFRSDRHVKGNNKLLWALVIVLGSTIGQLIYLFVGREDM